MSKDLLLSKLYGHHFIFTFYILAVHCAQFALVFVPYSFRELCIKNSKQQGENEQNE